MVKILELLKKYYGIVFFILFLVASVVLFQTCSTLKNERDQREYQEKLYNQNMKALGDSIKIEFNKKLNALEFSKQSFVVDKFKDLEKYNKQLYDELTKTKGELLYAIESKVSGNVGKLVLGNKLEILNKDSGYYGLRFHSKYSDEGFTQNIGGSSRFYVDLNKKLNTWTIRPDQTILDTNTFDLKITYGTRNVKDGYEVFAISKSKIVKFEELTGAYFVENQIQAPTKKKKWAIGPYVGFGLNTDYNLANPRFGWSAGFSIHYDVLQW